MILSPFTPLFFNAGKTDGIPSEYVQVFSIHDRILIELIGSADWDGSAQIHREPDHRLLCTINFQQWQMNENTCLRFSTVSLSPGLYSVTITDVGTSERFYVTDDPRELENTVLIQYSMKNNRMRHDAVFYIDGMQYFFDFRVHGGFKESNWSFGVDSEQFETQTSDICQLYGRESTKKVFTLGESMGVPVWFGEMLNRILVCSHVYFDGVKYVRKDASVPEISVQCEGVNSFVFSQTLQQSTNLDPVIEERNHVILRRTPDEIYRETEGNKPRLII